MAVSLYLVVVLVICALYHYVIYPLMISPLSHIPSAHPTATFSSAWTLWLRYIGKENVTVCDAHKRLGPIVKLGPQDISVNCVDGGIRTIYAGGYEKGSWYSEAFTNYGVDCMFSTEQRGPHTRRKRRISHIYAKSVLLASPAMAQICGEVCYLRMLPRLVEPPNGILDGYKLFSAVTIDLVSAYLFGLSHSSNHVESKDLGTTFLNKFRSRVSYIFWRQELPTLTRFISYLRLRRLLIPKWVDQANEDIMAWTLSKCDAAESAIASGTPPSPGNEPTVYNQLRFSMKKQEVVDVEKSSDILSANQRLEIASEILDHLAAGFDTTGTELTWLAWQLSRPRNARIQAALQRELRSLWPDSDKGRDCIDKESMPKPKDIDVLPLLHAIMMETLRLHAAVPGGQPRVTPPNTTLGPPGAEVHGIPAEVRVAGYAYTLHRNPDVFPEPDEWRPGRWLNAEGQVSISDEMNRWFWAFGSGGRMCIGSNMAMMQIKHVVVALWSNFSTTIIDDKGMVPACRFTDEPLGTPEGNFLLLHFEKLEV